MSHRYGSRSLPTRIKANEYEVLRKELNSSDHYDRKFNFEEKDYNIQIENMFEICYELDDNETPARYRLRHIDKIIQNYKENVKQDKFYNFRILFIYFNFKEFNLEQSMVQIGKKIGKFIQSSS